MAMSEGEIRGLIEKLKQRYGEYAKKNPTWFSIDAFNERYLMAVRNGMNMEAFILAEITNFEKIKQKYEKKKGERPFSAQVDRIMEELTARIRKYPALNFHPKAGLEISHFYGALAEFTLDYLSVLFLLAEDKLLKDRVITLEGALGALAAPRGTLPAKRIEDHILVLRRPGVREIDIERDKSEYLKESAFLLHEVVDFCDGLIEARNPAWETPLLFNKLFLDDRRKKRVTALFAGCTGYGAILKIRDRGAEIIGDFRLSAFKKQQ